MAPPPPRFSTPSAGPQAPRASSKNPRSASYAPASSASSGAPSNARSGADEFLSPVSKLNRSNEHAMKEQEARMKTIPGERAHRLAAKQAARLSGGSTTQSSVKRKLTDLEVAAAAGKQHTPSPSTLLEKAKKVRTSSPPRRSSTTDRATGSFSATTSRRVASHGGGGAATSSASYSASSLSASALKRHDERHASEYSDRVSAAQAADAQQRYLSYEQQVHSMQQQAAQHAEATAVSSPPRSQRSTSAGAQGLFARHADPSVMKTPPESTTSSPFKFPDYESSVSSVRDSPLPIIRTPPRGVHASPIQLTPRGDDGMVDLERVSTVSQLETLEGDDILSTMMTMTTPRVGRHFPSEHARTDSEEREIQFLRRRRLAASAARKSLDPNAPVVTNDMVKGSGKSHAKWSFDEVLQPVTSPSTGAVRRGVISKEAQQARDDAENAKAEAAENDAFIDDDDDDDIETTETKVARFSRAKQWGLRRFVFWVLAGAGLICAFDVAFPFLLTLFEPPLPYCDNNTSLLGEMGGEAMAVTLVGDKNEFTALQPYRDDCRACPLFGVCSSGALVSCLPPLEQRNGACVESKEVQYALEQIAKSIEKYVVDKATSQVCGPPQLPSLWENVDTNWSLDELSAARVVVLLSELKEVVLKSPFAETLMNISLAAVSGNAAAGYVFNRSMDLALSSFQKVTQVTFEQVAQLVGSNTRGERSDMLIQFSTSIAPFSCRARNQLLTHAYHIAIAVTVLALAIFAYHRWLVFKTKRALADRLVKEVRYFLLGRSHRTERFYPANHLRDNLFDTLPNVSPLDRKWLRESVWPMVATLVGEDSRVHSRIAPIHGKQMVVWEWISSNSPNIKADEKRRTRVRNPRKRYSI